jgi:hypothetical protein
MPVFVSFIAPYLGMFKGLFYRLLWTSAIVLLGIQQCITLLLIQEKLKYGSFVRLSKINNVISPSIFRLLTETHRLFILAFFNSNPDISLFQ